MGSILRMPPIVAAFFALDAGMVALHAASRVVEPLPSGVTQLFNLNREGNLPTWYSSMQWFCVAAVLLFFAWRLVERAESGGRPLLALGFLFLCFSLDEVAQIHERLGLRSDALLPGGTRDTSPFPHTGIWMFVIGIPVLALFAIVLRSVAVRLRAAPSAVLRIAAGLAVTALGAMLLDLIGNLDRDFNEHKLPALEEALEMLGATIVLWGSLDLLRAHGLAFGVQSETDASLADGR